MVKKTAEKKVTPPAPVATEKKKKHRRRAAKSKFSTPIRRLCKSLNIPQVNRDAVHIVDDAVQKFLTGLTKHIASMLSDSNKTLTQKTAKLAHIAYMDELGANDDITRGALNRADVALKHLEESLGPVEKKKKAAKKTAVKK
jgi:hypothetical protein